MTTRVVGDVAVRVGADVGPLKIGLQDGARSVGRFSSNSSQSMARLARNLRNVALAGAAMAAGLATASRNAIRSLDSIGKQADKIGVTTDALQELRFAADQTGVPFQTMDMALQRFTRRVAEARQGSGEAKGALEEMGIELFDAAGQARSIDDVLADVADAMRDTTEQSDRVRLAMRLFDSEGVALVNTLSDGSAALQDMRDRAREVGAVIDEETIRSAEDLNSELDALTTGIRSEMNAALVEAGPALLILAEGLGSIVTVAASAIEKVSAFTTSVVDLFKRSEKEAAQFEAAMARRRSNQDRRAARGGSNTSNDDEGGGFFDFLSDDGDPEQRPSDNRAAQQFDRLVAEREKAEREAQQRMIEAGRQYAETRIQAEADEQERLHQVRQDALAARWEGMAEAHQAHMETLKQQNTEIEEEEVRSGAARVQSARETEEAITSILTKEQRTRLAEISSAFGDLSTLMRTGNEKLFRIGQAAAIADAVVTGYKAAVDAWEKGMAIGGPPMAAAFTAASLAKTGALISSIASQQPNGGSGSQSDPGSGSVAVSDVGSESGQTITRDINVNLRGGLAGQALGIRDILRGVNEELGDGANLNVNIV